MSNSWRLACGLAAMALVLVLVTSLQGGGLGALAFVAYALVPYVLLLAIGRLVRDPWVVGGAGIAALATEIGIRLSVFVYPTSSTAAIVLVFSPVFIGVIALPAGAFVGYLSGRVWRAFGPVARVGIVLVWGVAVALTVIAFGRPELFPTTVAHRRAVLARIGDPRVVAGSDTFETRTASDRAAWYATGDFEGRGDEIAIIDSRGADLVDPQTFEKRGRVDFSGDMQRAWNWFSKLVRLDGKLAVVQTGGGFSETEVLDLDGNQLWRYRPDKNLPPTALMPADLDGDGRTELYASSNEATVRLDGSGKEVWRRDARGASLSAVAPRTTEGTGWVVATDYGRSILVWDENGKPLGELPFSKTRGVVSIVDWPARALVLGGDSASGVDLAGHTAFEIPLGDFSLTHAVTVRFAAGGPTYLALAGAAERDVKRWRLLIVSPERTTVYDEIFGDPIGVLKVRRSDVGESVLVSGAGGLRALRLRL